MTATTSGSIESTDYKETNLKYWEERAPSHAISKQYSVDRLKTSPDALSDVVSFDKPLLGSLAGQRCIHLQCHIGTDTLSLARLGADTVVGIDFSPASVKEAQELAAATRGIGGERVSYLVSDVYATADALNAAQQGPGPHPPLPGAYDIVYTGVGSLCWLPSITKWAAVVASLLRPGGRLFIREAHPILWSLDEMRSDGILTLKYPYFETTEPEYSEADDDYVDRADKTKAKYKNVSIASFNHGIGETVMALLETGMEVKVLKEHESLPWCHSSTLMESVGKGEFSLKERPNRMPHSFTLVAVKREG